MKPLRLSLLGFGTVGQWLAEALHTPQEVMVIGPGAGRFQAGQGILADLIAIAKTR